MSGGFFNEVALRIMDELQTERVERVPEQLFIDALHRKIGKALADDTAVRRLGWCPEINLRNEEVFRRFGQPGTPHQAFYWTVLVALEEYIGTYYDYIADREVEEE